MNNSKSELKICQINMHNLRELPRQFEAYLNTQEFNIICSQESSLNKKLQLSNKTKIIGTNKPRASSFFLDPQFNFFSVNQDLDDFFNVISCRLNNIEIYIINCYIPPSNSNSSQFNELEVTNKLSSLLTKYSTLPSIFVGDFNAKSLWWHPDKYDQRGTLIEDLITSTNFLLLNEIDKGPTFQNSRGHTSYIDLSFISRPLANHFNYNWSILKNLNCTSDHFPICINLTPKPNILTPEGVDYNIPVELTNILQAFQLQAIQSRNLRKLRIEEYKECIEQTAINFNPHINTTDNLDNFFYSFSELIHNCITQAAPPKTNTTKVNQYWFDDECKSSLERKMNLHKAFLRLRTTVALENFKNFSKTHGKLIDSKKFEAWAKLCGEAIHYYDLPFKILFGKLKKQQPIGTLRLPDGSYTQNFNDTNTALINQFIKSDNLEDDSEEQTLKRMNNERYHTDSFEPLFTRAELESSLSTIKGSKAPGFDLITAEILKPAVERHIDSVLDFFNGCLSNAYFPNPLKIAIVVPIPKPGSKDNLKDLRPISLLPTFSKLFERLILNRLWIYATRQQIGRMQFGFTPRKSCPDAINKAISISCDLHNRKKYVAWIAIDFSQAFDTAWWPEILSSLRNIGIPSNLYFLIKSYLSDRFAYIQHNNEPVAARKLELGCPQGSVLAPFLWNLAMESLLTLDSPNCQKLAYADDCLFIVHGNNMEDLAHWAEQAMMRLTEWCKSVKLKININKCSFMVIKRNKIPADFQISIDNQPLKGVKQMKYLGVWVDRSFNFGLHVDKVASNAKFKLAAFYRMGNSIRGYRHKMLRELYKAVIEPSMIYACCVWYKAIRRKTHLAKLTQAQYRYSLKIIKCWKTISANEAIFLTGNLSIKYTILQRAALYWAKNNIQAFNNCLDFLPNRPIIQQLETQPTLAATHSLHNLTNNFQINITGIDNQSDFKYKVYTDGSKTEVGTGGAFAIWTDEIRTHARLYRLENKCSVFQAEMLAIHQAATYILQEINLRDKPRIAIFSDSMSSILSIHNCNPNTALAINTRKLCIQISLQTHFEVNWVKAHSTDNYNNAVDMMAKAACNIPEEMSCFKFTPFCDIKSEITSKIHDHYYSEYQEIRELKSYSSSFFFKQAQDIKHARKTDISNVIFQFISGHGNFSKLKFKIGRSVSPTCLLCNEADADSLHVILDCTAVTQQRETMLTELERLAYSLNNKQDLQCFADPNAMKSLHTFIESINYDPRPNLGVF